MSVKMANVLLYAVVSWFVEFTWSRCWNQQHCGLEKWAGSVFQQTLHFLTEEIVGAQNFNFVSKFLPKWRRLAPNFAFLDEDFPTSQNLGENCFRATTLLVELIAGMQWSYCCCSYLCLCLLVFLIPGQGASYHPNLLQEVPKASRIRVKFSFGQISLLLLVLVSVYLRHYSKSCNGIAVTFCTVFHGLKMSVIAQKPAALITLTCRDFSLIILVE